MSEKEWSWVKAPGGRRGLRVGDLVIADGGETIRFGPQWAAAEEHGDPTAAQLASLEQIAVVRDAAQWRAAELVPVKAAVKLLALSGLVVHVTVHGAAAAEPWASWCDRDGNRIEVQSVGDVHCTFLGAE